MDSIIIYLLFALIAYLYASVGHGGASGYIALMTLLAFPQNEIKTNSLLINIFVSFISFVHFFNRKEFPTKLFILLVLTSVPMAFLGGMINLDNKIFKILLGIVLVVPILRLTGAFASFQLNLSPNTAIIVLIGAFIGFISGLLGIGGGILLSPMLILFAWCTVKQTAAVSALFIFLNSLSALLGKSISTITFSENIMQILLVTILGGFLGSYFGAKKYNSKWIRFTLSFVLSIACFKLLTT